MASELKPASSVELARRMFGASQLLLSRLIKEKTGVEVLQYRISLIERGVKPTEEERRAICETLGMGETYVFNPYQYGPPSYVERKTVKGPR